MKIVYALCAVMSFLALLTMPIGYYTVLRLSITVAALLSIYHDRDTGINAWNVVFGLIAIVFNPIAPVYFNDRDIWSVIDVVTGGVFALRFMKAIRT